MPRIGDVEVTRAGPVTVVEIDRPARRNAVDGATALHLFEAFQAFDADPAAAVAVLAGRGGHFCAGADLKALTEGDRERRRQPGGRNSLAPMGPTRMALCKPVIAAVEGYAVAGGMELALWADLRVMAEGATFGIFCRRFGVPLVDLGTIRLPRLIGESRAMDLILTGRPVGAAEAERIGLANRVVPDGEALAAAVVLGRQIAGFPQTCLRHDRVSVLQQWGLGEDAAIQNEFRLGLATIESGETAAGAQRFSDGAGRHGGFGG